MNLIILLCNSSLAVVYNPKVFYPRINSKPTKVLLSQTLLCLWKNQSSPQHWDRLLSCGWVFIQRHQVRLWFSVNIAKLVNFFRLIFDSVGFELQFGPKQKKILTSTNYAVSEFMIFCAERGCQIIQIRKSFLAKSLQAKCSSREEESSLVLDKLHKVLIHDIFPE